MIEALDFITSNRIAPACRHFYDCNGCKYQDIPYPDQLSAKSAYVRKILSSSGISDYDFLGIEESPSRFCYRNKMEFAFGDVKKGGELALGLRKRGRYYEVVTVEECQLVHEDVTRILRAVLDYFRSRRVPFFHRGNQQGVLRHLAVRRACRTGEILVNLVTTSQADLNMEEVVDRVLDLELAGRIRGILHTINDSPADVVGGEENRLVYGDDHITEELLGLKFRISPFSFFQTNTEAAERLFASVRQFAAGLSTRTVLDLYCGTGTIAQVLAAQTQKVVGIEVVQEAVEAARENARMNGLTNCEFAAADVSDGLKDVHRHLGGQPDLVVMDPPRAGVPRKALERVAELGSPYLIYVSCRPTSLARDLAVLKRFGYDTVKVKCIDMFPHTPHVESLAMVSRR